MSEKRAKIEYVRADGTTVDGPAAAFGVTMIDAITGETVTHMVGDVTRSNRMFIAFGMFMLAQQTTKKSHAPVAEWTARLDKITDIAWGDEKPPKPVKPPKVPKDPLAELVDVIKAVKAGLNLPFDEAATRAKLADPAFRRAAKKEPHVAAEFARRKSATAVASTEGVANL